MAEELNDVNETVNRIYEVGYHIAPRVKEEDLDGVVAGIRAVIEKEGGSFIAEGAPTLAKLAYDISVKEGGKRVDYDRAYFGWIKFEAPSSAAHALDEALKTNADLLRSIVFKTVREETRARLKAPTLREVRRTDTIKAAPKREEENATPVSEEELDKAIDDITVE